METFKGKFHGSVQRGRPDGANGSLERFCVKCVSTVEWLFGELEYFKCLDFLKTLNSSKLNWKIVRHV